MDQMADETLRADVKDKGRVNTAEESSTWVRGERIQSEAQIKNWRLGDPAETEPGETSRDMNTQGSREYDGSSSPLFSLKMYLTRSSSPASSTTDSLSSSQQSNMGGWCSLVGGMLLLNSLQLKPYGLSYNMYVDCAGIVLNCLYCRFYDMILMLPDSCERVASRCCPNYKQVLNTVESTPSNEDSCMDLDCGLFSSCQDASDCLELAMEISELCYH